MTESQMLGFTHIKVKFPEIKKLWYILENAIFDFFQNSSKISKT